MKRHAFTLLELMIAISLGMMIVYTAVTGFRAAASGISTANRMALSNSLLRAAFIQSLEEVDLWLAYDDPTSTDATQQKLRTVSPYTSETGRVQGLPFAPFDQTIPGASITKTTSLFGDERDRGWDASYQWPSADPRSWWRANAAEQNGTDLRMGDHSLYADTMDASPHPWLFRQMDQLKIALGYQGLCEYLPANMLYPYISFTSRQELNKGKMLQEFLGRGRPQFVNGDGGTSFAQGRYRPTKDTSFAILPLHPSGGDLPLADYLRWNRDKTSTGSWSDGNDIEGFYKRIRSYEELPSSRPAHWPIVSVSVARYVSHNRFAATCWIRWTDPLTGQQSEFSFNGFGTTLRGARQQRQPGLVGSGTGWARWYANGDARNSPTLDSPAAPSSATESL
ncbi:MAG TPA: prepilin-type N-terminal cleavage/methylation domain-containing protein [Planctomycetota bacterium]|jgi:type II secretory pathway pseudopilin PulG|nr:prepilin-type N-terminal cleavage/methylation domain-containing protein [Planctomycetota bacterium]